MLEDSAVKYVLDNLKPYGYVWRGIHKINMGRYAIINSDKFNSAIIFKKEWYNTFEYNKFKNESGVYEKGLGDTINCDDLKRMIDSEVKLIFILFHTGEIYYISLLDFLRLSHKRKVKEGKEVRSISIHHYYRLDKLKGVLNI